MEQFTNTEELLRRIRENVPEILGGESNPDVEDEVEQIMCVVENAPRVAPEGGAPGGTHRMEKTAQAVCRI